MPPKQRRLSWLIVSALVLVVYLVYAWFSRETQEAEPIITANVIRGPLEVTVLEGGNLQSVESYQIKSEVQGSTKILSIVEEGYTITPEDVEQGKVLVQLDAKELLDRQTEQELQYQNAVAKQIEAREQYDIQANQNESEIKAAQLAVKFARADLDKYLGADVAKAILDTVQKHDDEAPRQAAADDKLEEAAVTVPPLPEINFQQYASLEKLSDGEARQQLRKLENELLLAESELVLAQAQLDGTKKLYEKQFVTKNDLDNDEMRLKRGTIQKDSAETSRDLFLRYEFPKQAEKLLADYLESLRKLERTQKLALSRLAQAEANLRAAEAQLALQTRKRNELRQQIEKCTIRATRPGLVIYGDQRDSMRDENRIEEGAIVRERQVIITIPDMTRMALNCKIHEGFIRNVRKGQKARIRIDANPEIVLTGEVKQVAVLPNAQNRWLNPDLKVYETLIEIEQSYDWLKPGLSGQAEILVEHLDEALQVPLQAIYRENDESFCYVASGKGFERRKVETGLYNDRMIEIRNGLKEGERVRLRAPSGESSSPSEEEGRSTRSKPHEGAKTDESLGNRSGEAPKQ
jgi:multidrug efflux pump subunit AcrA (membrane-fusion protein)